MKTFSASILSILSLLTVSCGIRVNEQTSDVSGAVYPDPDVVFTLTQGEQTNAYEGPLIIWRPDADTKLVARAMAIGDQVTSENAKYVEFIHKRRLLVDSQDLAKTKLRKLRKQSLNAELDFNLARRSQMLESARAWIRKALLSNHDAIKRYHQYCDAVLIKYAFSDVLLDMQFRKRPVPLSICEHSYQSRGYFANLECDQDQGDYFECLWKGAILGPKSTLVLFDDQKQALNKADIDDLSSKLAALRTEVSPRLLLKLGHLTKAYRVSLDKEWTRKSRNSLQRAIRKFPKLFTQDAARSSLIEDLASEVASGERVFSLTDFLFNFPLAVDSKQVPEKGGALTLIADIKKREPCLVSTGTAFVDHYAKEINATTETIQSLEELISANEEVSEPIKDRAETLKVEAAGLVRDNNLAYAVWPGVQVFFTRKKGILHLAFRLDHLANWFNACYHLEDKHRITCQSKKDSDFEFSSMFLKQDYGKVTVGLENLDPLAFGFVEKEPSLQGAMFQILAPAKLTGLNMSLELSPFMKGQLHLLIGSMTFMKDAEQSYRASLTMNEPLSLYEFSTRGL